MVGEEAAVDTAILVNTATEVAIILINIDWNL